MINKSISKEDLEKLEKILGKEIKKDTNWFQISLTPGLLNSEALNEFSKKLHWGRVSQHQKLNSEDLERFKNRLDWTALSFSHIFTIYEVEKYKDRIDWEFFSRFQPITEDILHKFKNNITEETTNNMFLKNQYISNSGNIYYKLFISLSKEEIENNALIPIPDEFNELSIYNKIYKVIIQREDLITCEWAQRVITIINEYNGQLDIKKR